MNDIILSQEQQKAIEKIDGASLLLAVPGSGKTTTLISRIGRMIYDWIYRCGETACPEDWKPQVRA